MNAGSVNHKSRNLQFLSPQAQPDFSALSFDRLSTVPFDQLLNSEKRSAGVRNTRAKSIIALSFQDEKNRVMLDRKINKKIEKAGKV